MDELGLTPHEGHEAVETLLNMFIEWIDEPLYRVERKPFTPGQMGRMREAIQEAIEDRGTSPGMARDRREGVGKREDPRYNTAFQAKRLGASGLRVLATNLQPRRPPETEEFAELTRRARAARQALWRARDLGQRLSAVAHLIASVGLEPDPMAACPAAVAEELPREQRSIVATLRGSLRRGGVIRYSARAQGLLRPIFGTSAHQFDVHYSLKPGRSRVQVVVPIDQAAKRMNALDGASAVYDVTPQGARAVSAHGDAVQALTLSAAKEGRENAPATAEQLAPTEGPAVPQQLVLMASMADPARYGWAQVEGLGLLGRIEFFEARLREPLSIPELGEVAAMRYRFDTERRCVLRATACGPNDEVVWQTVYDEFKDLPDGSAVALRATTTLGDGALAARREAHSARPFALHCIGYEVVTRYEWFPEAGVRLPVSREIEDDSGTQECVMVFHDHEIEPLEDQ
jgi:hypothetical protein